MYATESYNTPEGATFNPFLSTAPKLMLTRLKVIYIPGGFSGGPRRCWPAGGE